MTPKDFAKKRQVFSFKKQKGKEVIADFSGGMITSNAGLLLIAELDKKLKITERFTQGFRDYRHPSYIDYSVNQLFAPRIYGLILGYEDLNDHEHLRDDPLLMLALEKLNFLDDKAKGLAGKSTLNRLEYCPEDVLKQSESRYHKIETLPQEIEKAFVKIFLDSYSTPPQNIIIDIEKAKVDYESRVKIGETFLDNQGFHKEELETIREVVPNSLWYRSFCYKTERSWSRSRRVVTKVEYGSEGLKMRHVVTSLPASQISPSLLYTKKYCPRGEMENRLKEQQLDLFADRTSTHHFESNQLRLWLSSMAYVLVQAFRQHCLKKTPFEKTTVGTIRLKLFKLGARVIVSVRRILIAIASSCPDQDILTTAYSRIMAIPETG